MPDFEVFASDDINFSKLMELIEKSSNLLQFCTITLLALKLSEGLLFQLGWVKTPLNTLNKKEQKDFIKVKILFLLIQNF